MATSRGRADFCLPHLDPMILTSNPPPPQPPIGV
ncbi:hypothetical protein COLO4_07842 [Corchorus olitorius]|uniref:Uncharacterized protein n=1 Tax=Corchorus olitorius TaxID=93759 RepID=A0A1R3KIH1_9ROSI|nr:hypothetical protein COLO4_07842 [Corchorus olitorius]